MSYCMRQCSVTTFVPYPIYMGNKHGHINDNNQNSNTNNGPVAVKRSQTAATLLSKNSSTGASLHARQSLSLSLSSSTLATSTSTKAAPSTRMATPKAPWDEPDDTQIAPKTAPIVASSSSSIASSSSTSSTVSVSPPPTVSVKTASSTNVISPRSRPALPTGTKPMSPAVSQRPLSFIRPSPTTNHARNASRAATATPATVITASPQAVTNDSPPPPPPPSLTIDDDEIPPPPDEPPPDLPAPVLVGERQFEIKVQLRKKSAMVVGALARGYQRHYGTRGTAAGQFQRPLGIAIDQRGERLYVCDCNNHRIQVLNAADGSYIMSWGREGHGPGQFESPNTIGIDEHNIIYVADRAERIQMFDTHGKFIAQFGGPGKNDGEFEYPRINIDSKSTIYIADHFNDRIQVLSSEGHLLASFGSNGSNDDQLSLPSYIALDEHRGYLYVMDEGNERIQVLHQSSAAAGGLALHHTIPRTATTGAICATTGQLWLVSMNDASLTVIQPSDGQHIRHVSTTIKGEGDTTSAPFGIALYRYGNITRAYVTDSLNCRITVFE